MSPAVHSRTLTRVAATSRTAIFGVVHHVGSGRRRRWTSMLNDLEALSSQPLDWYVIHIFVPGLRQAQNVHTEVGHHVTNAVDFVAERVLVERTN